MEGRFFSAAYLRFLFTASRYSLRVAHIAALVFVALYAAPASASGGENSEPVKAGGLSCFTIPVSYPPKTPSHSCDALCTGQAAACVAVVGPYVDPGLTCATQTQLISGCRCCSLAEGK